MIQWIIVAVVLAACAIAIIRHYRRKPKCNTCDACPLVENCKRKR